MESTTLTPVTTSNFTIDDLCSIAGKAVSDATPVKADLGTLPAAALEGLTTSNTNMDANRNKATKSVKTEKVSEADKQRDSWNTELNRKVSDAAKSNIEAQKEAGTELKIFLTPYWDVARENLPTETSKIKQMMEKYKASTTLQAHAATIGVAGLFTELENANTLTETLYDSRSQEYADNVSPSATSYKNAVVKNYNDFCTLIELTATYTPSAAITTLFNKLDEQRKKYAVIYNTSGKSSEETSAEGTTSETTK